MRACAIGQREQLQLDAGFGEQPKRGRPGSPVLRDARRDHQAVALDVSREQRDERGGLLVRALRVVYDQHQRARAADCQEPSLQRLTQLRVRVGRSRR